MRLVLLSASSLLLALLGGSTCLVSAQVPVASVPPHDTEAWQLVAGHLPDPATATAQTLETEGDILRARRFPEDAIIYYNYALDHGAPASHVLNKIGLTELELRNTVLAQKYFSRAVKVNKRDPQAWNNLGASEYLGGNSNAAVHDYRTAIKLSRREAVFHSNLATVYFERKDFTSARKEIALALKFDPAIFNRNDGQSGVSAHVLSTEDRARFAFEMARMYAKAKLEDSMLHSLAMASEAGMDIQHEMRHDPVLVRYVDDPRILTLVSTSRAISSHSKPSRGTELPLPALASEATPNQ